MSHYRLVVHQNNQLLGHFESQGPNAQQAITLIKEKLSEIEGVVLTLQQAYSEDRVLSSTHEGLKVLASTPKFKSIAL